MTCRCGNSSAQLCALQGSFRAGAARTYGRRHIAQPWCEDCFPAIESNQVRADADAVGDPRASGSPGASRAARCATNGCLAGVDCSSFSSVDSFLSTLNSDLSADARTYNACFAHYGLRRFMAGHRNGATGLMNPNTRDIDAFIAGFQWTVANLQTADNMSNDVRFWVQLQAI